MIKDTILLESILVFFSGSYQVVLVCLFSAILSEEGLATQTMIRLGLGSGKMQQIGSLSQDNIGALEVVKS
jgi:hypothetical protein